MAKWKMETFVRADEFIKKLNEMQNNERVSVKQYGATESGWYIIYISIHEVA